MNLLFYMFGHNCNVVFRILYFEQFVAGRPYVVYLSFAGSIGHSLNDNDDAVTRRKTKGLKADRRGVIKPYRKIFCPTVSCFANNYSCFIAKFACVNSTFLRVKSKMFMFCRDNLFHSVMIICSVEFVVLCFKVRCFFFCACVVFAALLA